MSVVEFSTKLYYRSRAQRLYSFLYGQYVSWTTWATCSRNYEAEIDPFRLLYIDPAEVRRRRTKELKQQFHHPDEVSEVKGGSWDTLVRPFEESDMYRSFKAHFKNGVPWEETEFYQNRVRLIEDGKVRWGCESKEDFDDRCDELDTLYNFIESNGYLTQRELRNEYDKWPSDRAIHWSRPADLLEVTVDIDRHGQFIFHEGRNRMTIAKLLDIDTIPVRVKGRHKTWQLDRDRFVRGNREDLNPEHPDLEYL